MKKIIITSIIGFFIMGVIGGVYSSFGAYGFAYGFVWGSFGTIPVVLTIVFIFHLSIIYLSKWSKVFKNFVLQIPLAFIIIFLFMIIVFYFEWMDKGYPKEYLNDYLDKKYFLIHPSIFSLVLVTVYYLVGIFEGKK